MAITDEHRKESLGKAFVSAVIAKAGFNSSFDVFDYGYDGTIKDVGCRNNRHYNTGFNIDFQLKSTCNALFEDDCIAYDLEAKNYNDLVEKGRPQPQILLLFVLPQNEDEWLTISEDSIESKKSIWWCSLKGNEQTKNEETKRIRIPRSQLFTPAALIEMMNKVKGG